MGGLSLLSQDYGNPPMKMTTLSAVTCSTLAALAGAAVAGPGVAFHFTPVALTGQATPDMPGTFLTTLGGGFAAPVLNSSGEVGFTFQFSSPGGPVNEFQGVFSGMPGASGMVTRTGILAPGAQPPPG